MYQLRNKLREGLLLVITVVMCPNLFAQITKTQAKPTLYKNLSYGQLINAFRHPPEEAKPWVFWYWVNAAVSKEGITADLEAMKQAGIGGAYLMPIKDTTNPPIFKPVIRQLTPAWWAMMRFAMKEADRLA